ncbi:MAG: RNA-binding protein [Thermoplasmata archaeon HGW-Thermoplasmata-1]|nr:MAG: RNA-binding protein [Thermoplasmata archaeon HGW-Thermoplasmata-1]
MNEETSERRIVLPGELIGEGASLRPGQGAYRDRADGRIYASRVGVMGKHSGYVNVVPLSGVYDPQKDDLVIGIISEVGQSNWLVNINGIYPAPLHVNEVPWRVEFGETSKYLNHGDAVLVKVFSVDETKNVQVSMKDRNLRKLSGGQIITVDPTKVPRVIGKSGSMINLVKSYTDVWIFVGQNGRIWISGGDASMQVAIAAIAKIESEAHTTGLTDRMKQWLEEHGTVKPAGDAKPDEFAAPRGNSGNAEENKDASEETSE